MLLSLNGFVFRASYGAPKERFAKMYSLHPSDAVQGLGCSPTSILQRKTVFVYTKTLLADAMKPLNVLSKFENHFAIRTVRFQVQLEADGYFLQEKFFAFATAASRASRYHLASFEPDFFTNPASKHLLGFAQTRCSAKNCADRVSSLMPNEQIFLEKNLFYENRR